MAQTLKFGNKTWATKVGSTLAYNDENDNFKPLPFAFTRSTSATRVNKQGLIEVVTNDRPRIDYTDTSDGVLLLEKAATNLITYSESINQYTPVNGTITPNALTSPEGLLNAVKFVENSANNLHYFDSNSISVTSGTKYTISVFAKYNGRFLTFQGSGALNSAFATFNLQNGTIEQQSVGTASIEKMTNDWYRCSIIVEMSQTGTAVMSILLNDSAIGGRSRSYQGDGASGVYLYGFQVESGNLSSYIPTQGSASTRVSETASGSGNSEVFNDSEGVLFCDIAALVNSDTPRAISISDGTLNNRVYMYYSTNNVLEVTIKVSGTDQASFSSTLSDSTLFNKLALKYKLNDFALWINGFEVDFDLSGSVFSTNTLDRLNLSYPNEIYNLYAKTKEIGYYNTALTDLELETLTSYKSWTSMVNELNLNIIYNG